MGLISRISLVAVFVLGSVSLHAQFVTSAGNTTTNDNVGINTATPSTDFHVFGKTLFQNTSVAAAVVLDRTTGKIASFVAGGASTTFAYDDTGIFKIESNSRSNIAAGTFGVGATSRFVISAGNVGIGTDSPTAKLHVIGNVVASGSITGATVLGAVYQDVAEWVPATSDMAPGTVVVLNPDRSDEVMPSSQEYDEHVAGVVSAQPGLILGVGSDSKEMVATTGRVKVKVDATRAPIRIGDLLVSSGKPGTAMKSEPMEIGGRRFHQPGTIIGKALEPLASGEGEILVLLSLQ
ncbi:MAG TPA: hypothetical protein VHL59_00290 [Thermoanaerobaculia bacterium]|nr:hypothetical protein [Thermoanaerobaculia bacterium]